MNENTGRVEQMYRDAASGRDKVLDAARKAASLTKPWVLPPKDLAQGDRLPSPFQSLGTRGVVNLEGRYLLALWPPGQSWFQLKLPPQVLYDASRSPEDIEAAQQYLFLRELQIQATLESAGRDKRGNERRNGFRAVKRAVLSQLLITGDTLEQLTDDYTIKLFRRDQYCTRRDSGGNILYHIIKEHIDPMSLDDEKRVRAQLPPDSELREKMPDERCEDLYTMVTWEPWTREWAIKQELNGHIIYEQQEPVSPFISTPFELVPPEDYGRGFVELHLGDISSLDQLRRSELDWASLVTKHHPILDQSSVLTERDLAEPTGTPLRGKVRQGVVQDLGWYRVDRIADFQVVQALDQKLTGELGQAMLMESASQPKGDRVTRFAVERIAMEIEGSTGGLYASIAEDQQPALLRRVIYQMERDKILVPLNDGEYEAEILTGLRALGRQIDQAKLMDVVQVIAQLGETAMQKIDMGVLVDVLARYNNVHEPGIIKTNEQLAAERQQQMAMAAQQAAAEKAIDVAGNVAEQTAVQQPAA